ncbi:hypothetical protein GCM10010191_49480 [Actinomadura vinacea]|uniref:VCBS repeat-containing protein n=1 Tax=Actinomadura vinacea TaxID=115336 RepID=A0ABN3JGW2_9ACTN
MTARGYGEQHKVTIRLVTGAGFRHSQVLVAPFRGARMTWLGLADVNGDRNDEVFIALMAGSRNIEALALELRDGRFMPLRGIKAGRIALHNTQIEYAGFTCSNGSRLTLWRVHRAAGKSPVYRGTEEVWSAPPGGAFQRLASRRVEFPADEKSRAP